jgi:hypothetical protein
LRGIVQGDIGESEDERDAVLGSFAAWGMMTRQPGWSNLVLNEEDPMFFTPGKTDYWFPIAG